MSGKGSVVDGTTSKVWLVTGASRGLGRAIAEAALSKNLSKNLAGAFEEEMDVGDVDHGLC